MATQPKPKKKKVELVEELPPVIEQEVTEETQPTLQTAAKSIFLSKTIWVNALALVSLLVQKKYGFVVDESIQVEALGVINIILRMITKEPVTWGK